jgi:hypothetical protein
MSYMWGGGRPSQPILSGVILGDKVINSCPYPYSNGLHSGMITYSRRIRDLFLKRYWLRCWDCELCVGPFDKEDDARIAMSIANYGTVIR